MIDISLSICSKSGLTAQSGSSPRRAEGSDSWAQLPGTGARRREARDQNVIEDFMMDRFTSWEPDASWDG